MVSKIYSIISFPIADSIFSAFQIEMGRFKFILLTTGFNSSPDHVGKRYVMALLDHFNQTGPSGKHLCLVSQVGGPSIKQFNECPGEYRGSRRLEAGVARNVCLQAINGLNYIHNAGVIHGGTDILSDPLSSFRLINPEFRFHSCEYFIAAC